MDNITKLWANLFIICMGLSAIGFAFAAVLGWKNMGCLLAGAAMIGVTFGAFLLGSVGMLHALERSETRYVSDGKDAVIVTLRLGPFKYSRTGPLTENPNKEGMK